MNLLAIDTSSRNISLSIIWRGKIIDYNNYKNFLASDILIYISKYIKKFSIDLKKIDAFIVGKGPGSFMGLRISHSIIKAFSFSLHKPIIAIGSFLSIAYPFRINKKKIAVISDARRNLIYAATFRVNNNRLLIKEKERLCFLKDFIDKRKDYFFLTYDENIKKEALRIEPNLDFHPELTYPSAFYLLELAKNYYLKSNFVSIDRLEPLYLYPKTCQIKHK